MYPPEESKMCLDVWDMLPQNDLPMKQILSTWGGRDGPHREWKTRCWTLLERRRVILVKELLRGCFHAADGSLYETNRTFLEQLKCP